MAWARVRDNRFDKYLAKKDLEPLRLESSMIQLDDGAAASLVSECAAAAQKVGDMGATETLYFCSWTTVNKTAHWPYAMHTCRTHVGVVTQASLLCEGTMLARDLANERADTMNPKAVADIAVDMVS